MHRFFMWNLPYTNTTLVNAVIKNTKLNIYTSLCMNEYV